MCLDTWRLNGGDTIVGLDPKTGRTWLRSYAKLDEAVTSGQISAQTATRLRNILPENLNAHSSVDEDQYNWIANTLKSKDAIKADWRFVIGHFPIYSASSFEHGDTKSLVDRLNNALIKGGVDAYFAGHDHILQVISKSKSLQLHYYGSGAGARKHTTVNDSYFGLQGSSVGTYGFMKHKVTKTSLKTTFVVTQWNGSKYNKTFPFVFEQTKIKSLWNTFPSVPLS
jgi:3',5'-cyclic AMP phosphodiesterase CpdA